MEEKAEVLNIYYDNESIADILKVSKPNKKHFCSYLGCTYAFDRPWKLDRHLNTHTNERPYKCDYPGCTKGYTNNSHLQRHKVVSHLKNKPPPESVPCDFSECKKIFARRWSMKRHYTSHYTNNTNKILKLKKIEQNCNSNNDEHSKSKVYFTCDICNESFTKGTDFKKHKRKHKVYCCDREGCIEKFTSWNNLRTHLKLEHPDKYQCDFCKNFYKNKWTLTEHVLSHLPFDKRDVILCPYLNCGRHYFYERNLDAHIRSYHQNVNYKCEIEDCGKFFTTKQKLNEHVKRHSEPTVKKKRERPKLTAEEKRLRREKNPKKKIKSMAAALSGLVLPPSIDKNIARNNMTCEVLDYIDRMKHKLHEEKEDLLNTCDNISTDELNS